VRGDGEMEERSSPGRNHKGGSFHQIRNGRERGAVDDRLGGSGLEKFGRGGLKPHRGDGKGKRLKTALKSQFVEDLAGNSFGKKGGYL